MAGFLLGACGGGGGTETARTTRTGVTLTGPATTASVPTRTRTVPSPTPPTTTSVTVETTTIDITTTVPVEPTTRPPLTITVAPPTTTAPTTTPTTTTTPAVAAPPTTTASSEPTSSTETPWGWIALVLALTGAAILGIVLWTRSRNRGRAAAHIDELERRTLVALDDVLASGSLVTGQVQALAAEARSLERSSSDQRVRRLRGGLDELAATLEADRTLRLGTPPPTQEQLNYSTALVRQQVDQLQGALRAPPAA